LRVSAQSGKFGFLSALACATFCFSQITVLPANGSHATVSSEDKPSVYEETIDGKPFVVTKVLVKAKIEHVWPILVDYDNATRIFPILKKCELVEDKGTKKIVRHEIAPSGVPGTYEYVLEIQECAPKTLEWHRLSGDFKEVDGFWKLEPAETGHCTLVTYASHVNGGFFIPQPLIKHQLHMDMPTALTALKSHAEGPTKIASHHLPSDRTE
jgi:ribosome-associated toxin RatA of RatAB toxin-antitoxin module